MIAYKTLRRGAVGRYSGFGWPRPTGDRAGAWVEVDGPLRLVVNAIHACRIDQLPRGLDTELWECELDEPVQEVEQVLLGRLLRPIAEWNEDAAREFVRACVERSGKHAADSLRTCGSAALGAALDSDGPEPLAALVADADISAALVAVLLDTADVTFASVAGMSACLVGFLAARVARRVADAVDESALDAEHAERRWQAQWLAERLALS